MSRRKLRSRSRKTSAKGPLSDRTHLQRPPRTAVQYNAKSDQFKDRWDRIVGVISKMRAEKLSLKRASQEAGLDPQTVKRWAGSALKKSASGRYAAKRSDQLLRILKIPDSHGTRDVAVRGSRQATLLANYWVAVHRYLESGDASGLEKFRGKSIKDADGVQIALLTDRRELNRLGSAGVLSFASLYARSS